MARCAYLKQGRYCAKTGIGNPPLCALHRSLLEAQLLPPDQEDFEAVPFANEDLMDELVDNFFEHPKVRGVFGQISSTLDRFGQIIDRVSHGQPRPPRGNAGPPPPPPGTRRPAPQQRRPPPPPPPPHLDPQEVKNAFVILGIKLGTPLTEELIKGRRRELTKIFHPDRGIMGNDESMKRVNTACDLLLAKRRGGV